MMRLRLIILIICVIPFSGYGQQETTETTPPDSVSLVINRLEDGQQPGKVKVYQDPRLNSILRKHYEFNKTTGISGFRILIYKGLDRTKANQARAEYESVFSELGLPVEVQYNEPDFSTLVGSFRTKEDAFRFKKQLMVRFTQAYIVQARITLD